MKMLFCFRFIISIFIAATLIGCGQKGALFLPPKKPPIEQKQEIIEQHHELESSED